MTCNGLCFMGYRSLSQVHLKGVGLSQNRKPVKPTLPLYKENVGLEEEEKRSDLSLSQTYPRS